MLGRSEICIFWKNKTQGVHVSSQTTQSLKFCFVLALTNIYRYYYKAYIVYHLQNLHVLDSYHQGATETTTSNYYFFPLSFTQVDWNGCSFTWMIGFQLHEYDLQGLKLHKTRFTKSY
jgi:hypothetical protein